jgi:hypothetical protein
MAAGAVKFSMRVESGFLSSYRMMPARNAESIARESVPTPLCSIAFFVRAPVSTCYARIRWPIFDH